MAKCNFHNIENSFIQENIPEDERLKTGLEEVFQNVFPVEDSHKNYILEYKSYFLNKKKAIPFISAKIAVSKDYQTINKKKRAFQYAQDFGQAVGGMREWNR